MPKISVIIPTYNRAHLLERAVRSVLAQTFRDLEIIVVDDASTDNTQAIFKEKFRHELDTEMIIYIRNKINLERSRSRNKGIETARGKYIALLDDDDIWLPHHLETLILYIDANENIACAFSKPVWLYENGAVEDKFCKLNLTTGSGTFYRNLCISGNMVFSPASLLRRELYMDVGGYREDISQNEDWEFFSRVAMNYNIGFTNTVTVLFCAHRGTHSQMTVGNKAYIKENAWKIIEQNSIKYNYHLENEIIGRICITMAENFIPVMNKSREYFFKALKSDRKLALQCSTWGLFTRIILGHYLYLKLKDLKRLFK